MLSEIKTCGKFLLIRTLQLNIKINLLQQQSSQQQPQVVQNTQTCSRTSSISVTEIAAKEQKLEEKEIFGGRPGLLKVPSNSNQDIQSNNNDVNRHYIITHFYDY